MFKSAISLVPYFLCRCTSCGAEKEKRIFREVWFVKEVIGCDEGGVRVTFFFINVVEVVGSWSVVDKEEHYFRTKITTDDRIVRC